MKSNCPLEKISRILMGIFLIILSALIILLLLIRLLPGVFGTKLSTPVYLDEIQPTTALSSTDTASGSNEIVETATPFQEQSFSVSEFDPVQMGQQMLKLINEVRSQEGLNPVEWDQEIANIAAIHAEEMAQKNYISHWDLAGYGPDVRFNLNGGEEWVRENAFTSWERYENGDPVPIDDWSAKVQEGQDSLMNSSGHRDNILEEGHTHVGIGFAYNQATGYFAIVQEFVNRYVVVLNDPPRDSAGNQDVAFQAQLVDDAQNPGVNLFYEKIPQSMTVEELNQTNTYISPAIFLDDIPVQINDDGSFSFTVYIDGDPGIYHIMIWVDHGASNSQAIDYQIWVQ